MSAIAVRSPLALRLVADGGAARSAGLLALVLAGSVLLAVSARVQVPFWPVPATLQTFAVMALAAAYGLRLGVATVFVYLAEGAMGLPVFAGGGGLVYLTGPTAGYLLGYLPAAAVVGWASERGLDRRPFALFGVMAAADALVFALGFAWLAFFAQLASGGIGVGPEAAWAKGVAPFLFGDLVKMALAAALVPAVGRLVRR